MSYRKNGLGYMLNLFCPFVHTPLIYQWDKKYVLSITDLCVCFFVQILFDIENTREEAPEPVVPETLDDIPLISPISTQTTTSTSTSTDCVKMCHKIVSAKPQYRTVKIQTLLKGRNKGNLCSLTNLLQIQK